MPENVDDLHPLGLHDGLPILGQKLIINKTGDGLSKSVDIAPRHIETDEEAAISGLIRHRKRRFDNVYTKPDKDSDEPPKIKGVIQVDIYEAVGIIFDDREGTEKSVTRMMAKISDKAEREAKEKAGQFRLKTGKGDEVDPVDGAGPGEIRQGVPDDEGAGETGE